MIVSSFDVTRLINDLGGPARIQTIALAEGVDYPPLRTLHYWRSKNWAPSDGLAMLVVVSKRIYPQFDLYDYLLTEDDEITRFVVAAFSE